jgi:hypothetical protein
VLGRWAEPGGDQERTYLVAVEADRVALVVQAGAAYMDRWRSADQALFFGIAVPATVQSLRATVARARPASSRARAYS